MTDEPSNDEQPDENAHIRALLAELGSGPDGEPMPAAVAARLDDTLARLVAERDLEESESPAADGNVVPLSRGSSRRWLPRAAAAAAAVIVLGVGGVAATNLGLFGSDSLTSADSGGASDSKATSESAAGATTTAPEPATGEDDGDTGADSGAAVALPQLTSTSFPADVDALLTRGSSAVATPERKALRDDTAAESPGTESQEKTPDQANALRAQACPGPKLTDGAVPNQVRYDGQRAVLVVHPERAGDRLVEAWDCAGVKVLASTTVTP